MIHPKTSFSSPLYELMAQSITLALTGELKASLGELARSCVKRKS